MQKFEHTTKFAKHIVAMAIKQIMHLTDRELVEFVSRDVIGKMLGYKHKPTICDILKSKKTF